MTRHGSVVLRMTPITAGEPTRDTLCGNSLQRVLKRYFWSTRPMFFPASILPMLVGSAWGWREAGAFDPLIFVVALIAVVLVHAGINVVNDVADDRTGTDRLNHDRIHPFTGGSRFIQNGIMTSAEMARWGKSLLAAGAALGIVLVVLKGLAVLAFGAIGIGLGIAYSLPPLALGARGLGELAVAIGFGTLPVVGSFWLQAETVSNNAVLLSLPLSFWVTAVLLINELPDAEADALAGKRTLVVRLGIGGSRWLYTVLQLAAFGALLVAAVYGAIPWLGLILPIGLFVPAVIAARAIGKSRSTLRCGILCTLWIHALGGIWVAGLAFSPF
ncbi:1,4-dihydroxy-2-naphthoate octaprenyltransferase [bacterium BMS3Bbin10]|nr:1,4-dihydroxy-2-naphthoate octaprenyltransferase [bacterium BMS3Bbin10]